MALGLWRLLGLDTLLQNVAEPGREEVPWPIVAAILTIARFCEPSSELHIETTWYRGTALEDLLGVSLEKVHTDRLYAGLDWLLPHKPQIEKHLKERLGALFDLEYDLLLYDVTSTYFEGQCAGNGLAKRGYSRDSRPDCLQVCIGLVVTTDGIPLGYEVFAGNRHDSTTVEEIVEAMEKKYGRANRIWVMDRGMVSEKNLKFLRERGGQYIVGTPKAMLRQFEEYLTRKDWHEVQEGVEVQLVPGPDGSETFVLARSADRREKEKAMHQRFVDRLEDGVAEDASVGRERAAERRSDGQPAAGPADVPILAGGRGVRREDRSAFRRRRARLGCASHGLATIAGTTGRRCRRAATCCGRTCNETDPAVLWKRYIQLTEAEWAFRITKDELEIRPIWHQKTDRVLAHILVCFLAYVLWKTLGQWMQRSGLGDAPRTLLEELAKIKSGDVVLPTRTKDGQYNGTVRLRCVTEPDEAQKVLLHRLGIPLPRRLRRIDEFVQM